MLQMDRAVFHRERRSNGKAGVTPRPPRPPPRCARWPGGRRRSSRLSATSPRIGSSSPATSKTAAGIGELETRIGNARWRLLEQQAVQLDKKQEPRDSDETNLPPASGVSSLVPLPSQPKSGWPAAPKRRRGCRLIWRSAAAPDRATERSCERSKCGMPTASRPVRLGKHWHAFRGPGIGPGPPRGRIASSPRAGVCAEYQLAAQLRCGSRPSAYGPKPAPPSSEPHWAWRRPELHTRERVLISQEDRWRSLLGAGQTATNRNPAFADQDCLGRNARMGRGPDFVAAHGQVAEERQPWPCGRSPSRNGARRTAKDPVAAKRLERLERQWFTQWEATANDLDRLQATLKAEAAQLDERSRQLRHDVVASERGPPCSTTERRKSNARSRSWRPNRTIGGDWTPPARQEIAEAKTARRETRRAAGPAVDRCGASGGSGRFEPSGIEELNHETREKKEKNESVLLFIS